MSAAFRLYRLKKHADQSKRGVAGITGGEGGGWCVSVCVCNKGGGACMEQRRAGVIGQEGDGDILNQ